MNDLSAPLASAPIPRAPIAPSEARFIRLGSGGRWAKTGIDTGTLRFGAPHEPHDLCLKGDWEGARDTLLASGTAAREVGQLMRELRDVYTLGPDCLWITLAEGRLWWGFAEPEVVDLRMTEDGSMGVVARRIIGGWSCHSIFDDELLIPRLSSRVTQVRAYQRTICSLREIDAVCRAINGRADDAVEHTLAVEHALVDAVESLIKGLHETDFEILADLTLAALGWRRRSRLGGTLADADLFVEQPATGERAMVQVKSRAGQAVLDDYVARADAHACDRMFFLCHTPEGGLDAGSRGDVHVWSGRALAEKVVAAGLTPWLIAQVR
ncbi:hypothetical protein [Lichenibacterium dinghuense]|uniref:hypothetical protein n=1 Tax=Lichenibacterium dinghuense TaxID=2895977 RepID=UPI001F4416D6|nr:hypothetical protein [Lichenibacterium sp. 6Y81]